MAESPTAFRGKPLRSPSAKNTTTASPPLVVIADDDESMRHVLQRALSHKGYNAVPVDDGGEIWPILEREDVRGLVLDLNMPGMNGWEVLRRLKNDFHFRHKRSSLGVVVVSAQSDPRSRQFAMDLGASAFLPKPIDLDDLTDALSRAGCAEPGDVAR